MGVKKLVSPADPESDHRLMMWYECTCPCPSVLPPSLFTTRTQKHTHTCTYWICSTVTEMISVSSASFRQIFSLSQSCFKSHRIQCNFLYTYFYLQFLVDFHCLLNLTERHFKWYYYTFCVLRKRVSSGQLLNRIPVSRIPVTCQLLKFRPEQWKLSRRCDILHESAETSGEFWVSVANRTSRIRQMIFFIRIWGSVKNINGIQLAVILCNRYLRGLRFFVLFIIKHWL